MRVLAAAATVSALAGVAVVRGLVAAWPWPTSWGVLLALPLLAVLAAHVRSARQRRLKRYTLGW